MQSGFTAHVTPAEWRWVTFVAVALVLLAFAPYALLALKSARMSDWQFMGILHNSRDGATYLSKMMLGVRGEWLVRFLHTPETHDGALVQVIYPALGQLARLVDIPPLVIFHVARVIASVFMYLAIYQLGATIWMRIRSRRIFFVMASLGAGFGWLYAIVTGGRVDVPDLSISEAFPLQSTFVNVHFPLAIACVALLASIIIAVFRPGATDEPEANNAGIVAVFLSLALAFLYPQGLVPLGGALVVYAGWRWWRKRHIVPREISWLLLILLPAIPLAVYYAAVVIYNPAMAEWARQNVTEAPSPFVLIIGFAIPLVIAVPGLYRAVRQHDAYDDRFMLLWLVVMVVAIYLPTSIQRRFAIGMMLPLAYFATRAMESYWFQWLSNRRWRYRLLILAMPVLALSHLFVLFFPALPVLANRPASTQGLFLERDYLPAFEWIDSHSTPNDVVLASEVVSRWLPGWASVRVVYGHPFETLQAALKEQQVKAWYGEGADCRGLLGTYRVKYVVYGPEEAKLGSSSCLSDLHQVARSGEVTLYAP